MPRSPARFGISIAARIAGLPANSPGLAEFASYPDSLSNANPLQVDWLP